MKDEPKRITKEEWVASRVRLVGEFFDLYEEWMKIDAEVFPERMTDDMRDQQFGSFLREG